jgi:hypothetical protein
VLSRGVDRPVDLNLETNRKASFSARLGLTVPAPVTDPADLRSSRLAWNRASGPKLVGAQVREADQECSRLRFVRRRTPIVARPTKSSTSVDGSGVDPSTGVLKVSAKAGSFGLFVSIPMQY